MGRLNAECKMLRIGIALGGGGAKGLAHIPVLEVLDELGIVPVQVAGTSVGAIVGALYCSGMSAKDIRVAVEELSLDKCDGWLDALLVKHVREWLTLISMDYGAGALLSADRLLEKLAEAVQVKRFNDLQIPLTVVAADFWKREQVVLDAGELLPAIRASSALPGLVPPAVIDGRVLVDGGAVNPVPWDLLEDCDVTVAVNVIGKRTAAKDDLPKLSEALFNTIQIMEQSIVAQKRKLCPPDVYVEPDIRDIRALEFFKAPTIFEQSEPAVSKLRKQLAQIIKDSRH
jgi:NTE family protein